MARAADAILAELLALPPEGWALPREPESNWGGLLAPVAGELARFERQAEALLAETDPRGADALLPEWERLAGLPDPCAPAFALDGTPLQTLAQRRALLFERLTARRRARPADYVALAASLGIAVSITEYAATTCEMGCEAPALAEEWNFAWAVNAAANATTDLSCEDNCVTPLRSFGSPGLECFIRRAAPPHTYPRFVYA